MIKVTSIETGSFLDTGFTAAQLIDDSAGSAQIAFSQLPPSGGKTGSGELVVFKIKALAAGTTQIKIDTAQLLKKDASAITVTTSTGSVNVTGGTSSGNQPASSAGDQPESSGSQPTSMPTNTPLPVQEETVSEVEEEQPVEVEQPVATEAPASQPVEQVEPNKTLGLAWLIPAAILLMAGGYFGGNLLRKITTKKKKKK